MALNNIAVFDKTVHAKDMVGRGPVNNCRFYGVTFEGNFSGIKFTNCLFERCVAADASWHGAASERDSAAVMSQMEFRPFYVVAMQRRLNDIAAENFGKVYGDNDMLLLGVPLDMCRPAATHRQRAIATINGRDVMFTPKKCVAHQLRKSGAAPDKNGCIIAPRLRLV